MGVLGAGGPGVHCHTSPTHLYDNELGDWRRVPQYCEGRVWIALIQRAVPAFCVTLTKGSFLTFLYGDTARSVQRTTRAVGYLTQST